MANSILSVWEVRTTGSDLNGGAYVGGGGGTDFSQQDAAQVVVDNSTITATTAGAASNVITFTGYTPTAADVGNYFQAASGTNITAGFYQITGQTATTWTVTGAANLTTGGGAGSAIIGKMGGALASPLIAGNNLVAGNRVWIKSGAYTNVGNTALRVMNISVTGVLPSSTQPPTWVSGYFSTRGDIGFGPKGLNTANRPVFQLATGSTGMDCLVNSTQYFLATHIVFDANGTATSIGARSTGANAVFRGCVAKNFVNVGFQVANQGLVEYCEVFGGTAGTGINMNGIGSSAHANSVHDNVGTGGGIAAANGGCYVVKNLIANNSIGYVTALGLQGLWMNTFIGNPIAIQNSGTNALGVSIKDNIIADSSTRGIQVSSAGTFDDPLFDGNSFFGNTTNFTNVTSGTLTALPYTHQYDVILAAEPCTSHTSGTANFPTDNFGLVIGSGAKSATWLTSWPGNTGTTGYGDMGAPQSQAAGFISPRPFVVRPPAVVSF